MNFIEKNTKFLSHFHVAECCGKILVEESIEQLFIDHWIIMQALIINNAKKFKPIFIKNDTSPSIDLLHSFIPSAEYRSFSELSFLETISIKFMCIFQLLRIVFLKNVMIFTCYKTWYGDLLYDTYLAYFKYATIRLNKLSTLHELYHIMIIIATKHAQTLKLMQKENFSAVLVYQMVSIPSVILYRVAMNIGCGVYINMYKYTLRYFNPKEKIIYPYTPTKRDISNILNINDFDKKFQDIHKLHIDGMSSRDAKYAFTGEKDILNRSDICLKYNLDIQKKNIFIMLHAFTDHPHTHFGSMLFKDYYYWFMETLHFVKSCKEVNWIFKRHPAEKLYPVQDVDFIELFSDTPDNVVLLNPEDKLDLRSLQFAADAVVTCMGSAGFEIPALYGIPSVIAGNNFYSNFNFTIYPKTKEEYFNILKELKSIQRLDKNKQMVAKAVYMFIHYYSFVPYSFLPKFTLEETRAVINIDNLLNKIISLYDEKHDIIYYELQSYIDEVEKSDFKALRKQIQ